MSISMILAVCAVLMVDSLYNAVQDYKDCPYPGTGLPQGAYYGDTYFKIK